MNFKVRIQRLICEFNKGPPNIKIVHQSLEPPWIYELPTFLHYYLSYVNKKKRYYTE